MVTENKTCKDCEDFEKCPMWLYSYDPCPLFRNEEFEEDLSDGALD